MKLPLSTILQISFDMLYFIGLGLGNEEDITLRGLKAVKSCEKVFLEHYTSILGVGKEALVHNLFLV